MHMRKGFGVCCIALGICCLLASVGFLVYNKWEAENARNVSREILQDLREPTQAEAPDRETDPVEATESAAVFPEEMPTTQVDGYDCLGVLSIPVLELELPVLADWDYEKLKSAPCHYYGSCYASDFVIAAHNYPAHFGRLSQLRAGDLVVFTDVTGTVHCYEVILLETLAPTATEEMITSGFDLSLYTCTPGGGNRVTVRCRTVQP
jgi:sortase A